MSPIKGSFFFFYYIFKEEPRDMNNEVKLWRNKSTLLTLGSTAGVGVTGLLAANGQKRADAALMALPDHGESLTRKERLKLTWKYYIPAGLSGLVTIGSIFAGRRLDRKEIATLTASIGVLVANRDKVETVIKEKYGEEALLAIKNTVREGKAKLIEVVDPTTGEITKEPETKIIYQQVAAEETGNGNQLFIDEYSGRAFRSSIQAVEAAHKEFNKTLLMKHEGQDPRIGNYLSYNDLFALYNIRETEWGLIYGWWFNPNDHDDGNVEDDGIQFDMTEPMYSEKYGEEVVFLNFFDTLPFEGFMEY